MVMQEFSVQSHHQHPEILKLEMTVTPVSSNPDHIDLSVTLDFGQFEETLGEGRFQGGLTGGRLTLTLKEGELLTNDLTFPDLEVCFFKEEDQFVWQFYTKITSTLTQQRLISKLATVKRFTSTTPIELTFEVAPADVQITETQKLWFHQVTANQLAVLERKIAIAYHALLTPYLNRVVWGTSDTALSLPETATLDSQALLANLQRVINAQTDQFLELAQLANLNPLTDFSGAKLLGATLRNLDLSHGNFHRAYLRGADLSDIDLSSADLSQANLGGADLSGAYLSDADLTNTNFHLASLALANLSGADLNGADLSGANLSNANLSDTNLQNTNFTGADLTSAGFIVANLEKTQFQNAKVENTRFKDNPGLTATTQAYLQQHGAIFEG